MITLRLTLLALLSLAACATLRGDPAPTCDGRQRRPANPYGSVLVNPAQAGAAPASSAHGQSMPPTAFPSCP